MIVAGSASPLLLASAAGGYNLTRSLRLRRSASAYLNRTQGTSTNQSIGTWSFWCKRGELGTTQRLFEGYTASSDTGVMQFEFNSDNTFSVGGWTVNWRVTTQVFRDPSAWYHIVVAVDTTQATANNRIKVYVNGTEITSFSTTNNPSQNSTFGLNNNLAALQIGRRRNLASNDSFLDGYLTEVNFVDGQALTPSSFGANSTTTGVWQPKKYAGTYGTNGFYLPFTDNSGATSTTIGKDFSGNSNNWTPNNISVTAGSTYDSMTDVPTLTSATAANFCVLNPLRSGASFINSGNLTITGINSGAVGFYGTMYSTGWYAEVTVSSLTGGGVAYIGIELENGNSYSYVSDGTKQSIAGNQAYSGVTYTTGDVIGIAYSSSGTLTFYKNNSSQGTAFSGLSGNATFFLLSASGTPRNYDLNFGQRPFAYTPPTGFVALNTFNLPTPTIGATASTQANKYFDATTYTGNGGTLAVTNAGGFQPDLVWVKARAVAYQNNLYDSVRGATNALESNGTDAAYTLSGVTAFNSNGFTLGSNAGNNLNASTYVAWQWRASNATAVSNTAGSITSTVSANTSAGFSVVTYTGTGSAATVGHGLGVAPKMVIVKRRNSTGSWPVYHASLPSANYELFLERTEAAGTPSSSWNNTAPTSTVFSIGTGTAVNTNTGTYVAYCFSEVAGYSKFGGYAGNGSADGSFIFTGFRPRYVMVKRTDSTGSWVIWDSARDTYNVAEKGLLANLSNAEDTTNYIDFLSNGFKLRNTFGSQNASGGTYIYMAFSEFPFKYSLGR